MLLPDTRVSGLQQGLGGEDVNVAEEIQPAFRSLGNLFYLN